MKYKFLWICELNSKQVQKQSKTNVKVLNNTEKDYHECQNIFVNKKNVMIVKPTVKKTT